MPSSFPKNERNSLRRLPSRGSYDRDTVYEILDMGYLCHAGFVHDGQPVVIPTAYGRKDDVLYFHGSIKSRMMQQLAEGIPVCITVTHLNGLVLARSAFHHSFNYHSVMLFGQATELVDDQEKEEALRIITDHILPGRWAEVRLPTKDELKATAVLKLTIEEGSAKIRTGGPKDDQADYALPIWAGVVPVTTVVQPPIPDPLAQEDLLLPESVKKLFPNAQT